MATGVQVYTSADSGAPQLYGDPGKLTDILDAVLVNGYGSRTAAGTAGAGAWAISFTATNKRVYRPSAGNRLYLRVHDNATGTGGAKEALIRGAESWSDIDTPSGPMPTNAQSALTDNSLVVRKSATADATTARPWLIVADDRTVYMFAQTGDGTNSYFAWMWGDFYSELSSDNYRTMISGRVNENSSTGAGDRLPILGGGAALTSVITGHFLQRTYAASGGSITATKCAGSVGDSGNSTSVGIPNLNFTSLVYPTAITSKLFVTPVFLYELTPVLRGRMRGFWQGQHAATYFNDGDVFSGTGDLAGRTFRFVKFCASGTGYYIIETSDTWDTSS